MLKELPKESIEILKTWVKASRARNRIEAVVVPLFRGLSRAP